MQVSDLDGTMVDESREADSATAMFRDYWENVAALCNSVLVYNTGRSIGQFEGLYKHKNGVLAMPDAVITAVGTKVFFMNREVTRQSADGEAWCGSRSAPALPPCLTTCSLRPCLSLLCLRF